MSHSPLNSEIKAAQINRIVPVCGFSEEAFTGCNKTKVRHNLLSEI